MRTEQERQVNAEDGIRILRISDVILKTGLSRTTIYQKLRDRDFPRPVELGPRAIGFVEAEIECFLRNLIRQRDEQEVSHGRG